MQQVILQPTTKIMMVLCGVSVLILVRCKILEVNWKSLVPKTKELQTDMAWESGVALILIICMVLVRWFMNRRSPIVAARPVFGLYLGIHTRWIYPLSVLLQELFVKAFVQYNLKISMPGKSHEKVIQELQPDRSKPILFLNYRPKGFQKMADMGFPYKFPAKSEVVRINLHFSENS